MQGPARQIKSNKIVDYKNLGTLFKWTEDSSYLIIDKVAFRGNPGAILCYHNPPVHQIGTKGLYAYHDGLDIVFEKRNDLQFLILCDSNAPVHSGGDLKESLTRLRRSIAARRETEAAGVSKKEIDRLFSWGENRLEKGVHLYRKIRNASQYMRVVGICGGGMRFGGSAEIPLMADYLIGDSRSGMCFSEALIGIIPGWGGITRVLVKAGLINSAYMAKTANPVFAPELKAMGIYDNIVEIPFELPKKQKTGHTASDKKKYLELLEDHDDQTGALMLPEGLKWATYPIQAVSPANERERETLVEPEEIALEVNRRADPYNYARIWGKPLRDVKHEIDRLGRPLAPQSIDAIDRLLGTYDASTFNEEQFINEELWADAELYRDPRFLEGLIAQLDQRVPDFRQP